MSNGLSQIITITASNLRSVSERKAASIVAVAGIAGVVAILVGVLSMREGFRATLDQAGAKDVAIVLRSGSAAELSSGLTLDQTRIISGASSIVQKNGVPAASPELYVIVDVPHAQHRHRSKCAVTRCGRSGHQGTQQIQADTGPNVYPGSF